MRIDEDGRFYINFNASSDKTQRFYLDTLNLKLKGKVKIIKEKEIEI